MDYDQLIKDWAADKIGVTPGEIESVQFGEWIGCYSSWTCDYGIHINVRLTHGRTKTLQDWTFPSALQDFGEYVEAQERLSVEHGEYHGWREE